MSAFLPEPAPGADPGLKPAYSGAPADALLAKQFGDPNAIFRAAPQFFAYLLSYIEQANLLIPVGQLSGFSQFTVKTASEVTTQQSTTSTTPTDLSTSGPTISGLANGTYFVIYRAIVNATVSGSGAVMSVSLNGDGSDVTGREASTKSAVEQPITWWFTTSLSSGNNNTLQMKYFTRDAASAAVFASRHLAAIKYQNA